MDYKKAAEDLHQLVIAHVKSGTGDRLHKAGKGELFALNFLRDHDGDALPSSISEAMCCSSARTASLLNTLEQKGMITRRIDPSDRRQILVSLTDEGNARAAKHQEYMHGMIERTLRALGEDDTKELLRLVGRLVEIGNAIQEE